MDREAAEFYGDWSPPQVRGIFQFEVVASADVAGVRIYKKVTSRRIFKMEMSPCPMVLAQFMGTGLGSMIHANPIELMRRVRSWRGPIPAEGEQIADPEEAS